MAEPPTRTLPHQGAGGPHGLLATKLYLPRAQPGHVPRPHLLERLRDGLARGLVPVCAPAGFGKTALAADWARDSRRWWPGCRSTRRTTTPSGSGAMSPPALRWFTRLSAHSTAWSRRGTTVLHYRF